MSVIVSERIQQIKPSATFAISGKAQQLKAEGKDIINLGTGEPDFDTPNHIKEAAIKAIHDGATKYTPTDGTPVLKKAIIDKLNRDNQLQYEPNQILVSNGAKQSFFNLISALINPNDEVIIPTPYWVSYPDIVKIFAGKPVILQTNIDQHFKISADQLAQAITPKTKLFVMNSPSNPSGMAYTHQELKQIAEVLLKHPHVMIASDDIYEQILWSGEAFANLPMLCPELKARTIVINGVSKTYAMTGWRIGYAAGDANLIGSMKKTQEQSTSNPCSISQAAAVAALNGSQQCVTDMTKAFKERHDILISRLNKMSHVKALPSDGTFYNFINVQSAIQNKKLSSDVAFSEYLLNEAGVAMVPGSAFGNEGYIRMSFATSIDNLNKACDRLEKVLNLSE